MLASRDGKIVCENTLDARLDVVFRQKLPEVPVRNSDTRSLMYCKNVFLDRVSHCYIVRVLTRDHMGYRWSLILMQHLSNCML